MCYNNYVGDNVAKIVLVCGIHGSGKSTLLRTMHGYTILAASEVIRNNNNGKCDNKKEVASIDNGLNHFVQTAQKAPLGYNQAKNWHRF